MTNRKIEYWVIQREANAEFLASMEEVLQTYEKLYDPDCPVVCNVQCDSDEQAHVPAVGLE